MVHGEVFLKEFQRTGTKVVTKLIQYLVILSFLLLFMS